MSLFNEETLMYLKKSFSKTDFSEDSFNKLLEWLSESPKWSTIRVNKNLVNDLSKSLKDIENFLQGSFESINKLISAENSRYLVPRCNQLSLINECIFYESSKKINEDKIRMLEKFAIVDVKCAQAIFRGADIFIPGVISLSLNAKANDLVSIFADLKGKCLRGSDASEYFLKNKEFLKFIGNGWSLFDRDDFYKKDHIKNGKGIKIKELSNGTYIPSFINLNQKNYYPQNLPSMLCARILDPKPGQLILDMCAAPGGKTTHIAELINNKGRIIAFDKIPSKIQKMKELCVQFGATSVECYVQDASKIDFNVYEAESFDRVLVDSPCSALGQRPLIFNKVDPNQLKSYINYQKMILENAVKLLKPGGYLVFSTCTITLEENEEQVSWLLNRYKFLKLIDQSPYQIAESSGLKCRGLTNTQLKLLQRFQPNFDSNIQERDINVLNDTNGFFISKFTKEL